MVARKEGGVVDTGGGSKGREGTGSDVQREGEGEREGGDGCSKRHASMTASWATLSLGTHTYVRKALTYAYGSS